MNIGDIMSCYCKARETQAFYTNCLEDKNLSEQETRINI